MEERRKHRTVIKKGMREKRVETKRGERIRERKRRVNKKNRWIRMEERSKEKRKRGKGKGERRERHIQTEEEGNTSEERIVKKS